MRIGLGGEKAGTRAQDIVNMAKGVLGIQTDDALSAAIQGLTPEQITTLQMGILNYKQIQEQEDTKRLQTVNETMRAEVASESWWKSGWRPYWGWITGTTFAIQMLGATFIMGYTIIWAPENITQAITALTQFFTVITSMWLMAMAVLGVTVLTRSRDKGVKENALSGLADKLLGQ